MQKASSRDGTAIAFDRVGNGPPVILVVGAFNDRMKGAPLAAFLSPGFTVFTYDRRGRGDSGDSANYAVEREIEDLDAVIHAAGGSAFVMGYSSGAVLALQAAARGVAITKLALYDAPPVQLAEHANSLAELVLAGHRGAAVEYFQTRVVGIPAHVVEQLRNAPFRPALEAMAHTLVYDATIMSEARLTAEQGANIRQPTLAIAGGAGPAFMRENSAAIAASLPNARAVTLEGETHEIVPEVLGPVLRRFFVE